MGVWIILLGALRTSVVNPPLMSKSMTQKRNYLGWCGAVLLIITGGCAPAYHAYPCGCIPYGYDPPPPLAYPHYGACPTPVAEEYAFRQQ